MTTMPAAPVSVTVFPEMVAGPLFIERVTGRLLDVVGGVTVKGADPTTRLPIGAKAEMI
jgi:hypothetical protein